MELLQLQYFRTVARLEHMTKAAEEIRIAQPALSKTIARLEKDLGVPLFDRKGKTIQLNLYGKAFLKKVESALILLEEGRREVEDLAGMDHGRVHLATTTHKCFSDLISSFISLHPNISMQIIQASSEDKVKKLLNVDLDFCITFPPIQHQEIEGYTFLTEKILLAVPLSHPFAQRNSIHLNKIANDSFINFASENPFRKMTDQFCRKAGFVPKVVCEVDEYPAIIQFIQAGVGVAFLPETLVDDQENRFHLLHIDEPICQRTYQLAWLKNRYLSKAAKSFHDFLLQHFLAGIRRF